MNKMIFISVMNFFCFSIVSGQKYDTIEFSINMTQYEKVAKEELSGILTTPQTIIHGKYTADKFKTLSIPVLEWNQKAQTFNCESNDKLENLLLFEENPYFQMVLLIDNKSNIVSSFDLTASQTRTMKRIKDSIEWASQTPNIPFSHFSSNPFPDFDLKQLNKIYKFHLIHPNDFIFRIANFEGFWVIRNYQLYKLEGTSLRNANQYLYTCSDEYIRDIAVDAFRTGYKYEGCFSNEKAKSRSKQGKSIIVKVNSQ